VGPTFETESVCLIFLRYGTAVLRRTPVLGARLFLLPLSYPGLGACFFGFFFRFSCLGVELLSLLASFSAFYMGCCSTFADNPPLLLSNSFASPPTPPTPPPPHPPSVDNFHACSTLRPQRVRPHVRGRSNIILSHYPPSTSPFPLCLLDMLRRDLRMGRLPSGTAHHLILI